jgi:hypothetical protein
VSGGLPEHPAAAPHLGDAAPPAFTAARYSHLLGDSELDRFAAAHTTGTVGDTVGEGEATPGNRIA